MRPALPLVLAILLALPLAAAEENHLTALGGQGGLGAGVLGFQWDDDSAIGMRYWFNSTGEDQAALLLTTCVVLDSGAGGYCERHRLTA